jgi:lipid II:glycine glycyltransferase (peptidoglycan interpeptide bridge formation enzyme)
MRGQAGRDCESREGQGEVIEKRRRERQRVSVRPVPLSFLDDTDEMLQTGFWGQFKQAHGWRAHSFSVTLAGGAELHAGSAAAGSAFGMLVLSRRFFRMFSLAYVPFGPVLDPVEGRGELLSALARALRSHLPRTTLFLRFDLPWRRTGESPVASARPRVTKAASNMQPPDTVIVDITPPLEQVLGSMKSKTRYNVRLSGKKGVIVSEGGPDDLDRWYALYRETSSRDRIAIHSRAYYQGLFQASQSYPGVKPTVKLLLARHGEELLAGNIVAFWKSRAAYLYGASSGEKRNLMPTYALQWEAIRMAREAGCASYDLYGVPPQPDPDHPMFGLYQFKTGFSDCVVERWGTWDVPFRPALYVLYRAAEAVRMLYYRKIRKRSRRRGRTNAAEYRGRAADA